MKKGCTEEADFHTNVHHHTQNVKQHLKWQQEENKAKCQWQVPPNLSAIPAKWTAIMPTWHKTIMLQHNKKRIAGVDAAADDVADTTITMIKIMVNEDDGDKDDDTDNDDAFNQSELKNMQESL